MSLPERLTAEFRRRFAAPPALVVRAPGRVNLIGEHTDYNDGFVLPMAIDRSVWIALRPRPDGRIQAWSLDAQAAATDRANGWPAAAAFALDDLQREGGGWVEYIKGVAWALQAAGHTLRGWEGLVAGDVPIGAGLSSSAALEVAAARAFAAVSGITWEPAAMARLAQQAENEWVGMRCGIMDQMISAAARAGHALLIDCRSLATQAVPLPPGVAVVILDTATRRGLVDSAYNERRAQCEAAARFFGVASLRDLSPAALKAGGQGLEEVSRRRARHVLSENARTLQAVEALRRGAAAQVGRLMDASHASLRDDFAVSSDELDRMAACARGEAGCYGARMTGAGFGGCAVALVDARNASAWAGRVAACYQAATGLRPQVYVCTAAAGAEIVSGH
jgi:galactokinase